MLLANSSYTQKAYLFSLGRLDWVSATRVTLKLLTSWQVVSE